MSAGGETHLREREQGLGRRAAQLRPRVSFQSIGFLAASGDLVVIVITALLSAAIYHSLFLRSGVEVGRYAQIGGICFLNFVVIGTARKSYRIDALLRFRTQVREVAVTWAIVAMLSLSLIFAAKAAGDVSRGAVALFFVTGLFALLGWRRVLGLWMAKAVEADTLSLRQVILIADRDELVRSDVVLQLRRAGYSPAVTLTFGPSPSVAALHELAAEAIRVTRKRPINSVMLSANWSDARVIDHVVGALRVLPLSVHLLPDQRTAHLIKAGGSAIAGLAAAEVQRAPLSKTERAVKRLFDVGLASAGLVLLTPLLIIAAVLIKVDSPGRVFFLQTRNGFSGRPFRILKFRTMTVEDGAEFSQATRNDPRVTRVGRWLRKTSIDELPQLWNVVRGDMSIVGPRPHPTALDKDYQTRIGSYAFRQHVKPGLTGWAQVHGFRGETTTLDRMRGRVDHDLHYINHWSIFLDMLIVLMTLRIVFRDPAAF